MDAAPGSLLAYATAPGNLASDGRRANGLYTENLLRELQVPETKIEDVFKRVRLAVRRESKGKQIPWESTSLEEDFYFLPPAALRKGAPEEEEAKFREELSLYESAANATVAAPLEAYLARYPSGRFSELAQLRLDKVLAGQGEARVEPASSAGNPFTAGTARADTRYRVGDRYSYSYAGTPPPGEPAGAFTAIVTAITDDEVVFNGGGAVLDLLGNTIRSHGGVVFSPRQDQPLEYALGRRWSTRFTQSRNGEVVGRTTMDFHIARRENVTVPAGTFDCFRIEMSGRNFRPGGAPPIDLLWTLWYAPERVRRPIARDRTHRTVQNGHVKTIAADRIELVSFHQD